MNNIAIRYAESLFEIGIEENKINQYINDLNTIESSIDEEIIQFFMHPTIMKEEKIKIIEQCFKDTIDQYILNFLKLLIQKYRFNQIFLIIEEIRKLYDAHLGIKRGFLYTANELSKEEITSIEEVMSKKEKTKIKLEMIIQPSLIGGIKVVINNHVVDGSIQNRLLNLKGSLLNGKVGE